jgi:hypothetical protein
MEVDELRTMAMGNPEQTAEVCWLILTAPSFPTAEDAAELDRLIVRLCELEPWLAGFQADMLAARLRMAPAQVHIDLARFRQWVRTAEAKHGAALGAGRGESFAP